MRLIDADALREWWLGNGQNEYVYDANSFLYSIDDAPTVDAVEVVRCKDCKHFDTVDCAMFFDTKDNDFCSWGERKEECD